MKGFGGRAGEIEAVAITVMGGSKAREAIMVMAKNRSVRSRAAFCDLDYLYLAVVRPQNDGLSTVFRCGSVASLPVDPGDVARGPFKGRTCPSGMHPVGLRSVQA